MDQCILGPRRVDVTLMGCGRIAHCSSLMFDGGILGFGQQCTCLLHDVFFEAQGGSEEDGGGLTQLLEECR